MVPGGLIAVPRKKKRNVLRLLVRIVVGIVLALAFGPGPTCFGQANCNLRRNELLVAGHVYDKRITAPHRRAVEWEGDGACNDAIF
jgi:hypothetical protein